MTLQKDLKIFRFSNRDPHKLHTERYDYQLWNKNRMITNKVSNNEFRFGLVTLTELSANMELHNNYNPGIEDSEAFLITVKH